MRPTVERGDSVIIEEELEVEHWLLEFEAGGKTLCLNPDRFCV
jgi:hypothetical protein